MNYLPNNVFIVFKLFSKSTHAKFIFLCFKCFFNEVSLLSSIVNMNNDLRKIIDQRLVLFCYHQQCILFYFLLMQSYFYMWSSFNLKRVEFVVRQQRDCDVRYKNRRLRLSSILLKRTIHLQIVCYVKMSFDALTPRHATTKNYYRVCLLH